MTTQRDLSNDGVILLNQDEATASASYRAQATIIVSGLARSGTSMIAHVLRTAGLFFGSVIDDTVNEDVEFGRTIRSRDRDKLRELIAARNEKHAVWGFKRPNLHVHLRAEQMALFRNPLVIMSFRDPIAIARRNAVAEFVPEKEALQAAIANAAELGGFATQLDCPLLAVSYEKAIRNPALFVNALLNFVGLTPDEAIRSEMIAGVEPAPKNYETKAALYFDGHVDRIDDQQMLVGWCRQLHAAAPVALELLVDGKPVKKFMADVYREDLEKAGIGNGHHGFKVSLEELALPAAASLAVQVQGRTFRVAGSDRTVAALRQRQRA